MKFLVDNQPPPALARLIQDELGVEATHVAGIGMRGATDAEIWGHAAATGTILISEDEDFAYMALSSGFADLLWIRIGNCRRAVLLQTFRDLWPRILRRLAEGDRFIEIR